MKYIISLILLLLFSAAFVSVDPKSDGDGCRIAEEKWKYEEILEQGSPQSLSNLDSIILLCPTFSKAWRERGVAHLKRGEFGSWGPYINKAVELDPRIYLPIRGWCRFDFLRDYEGAIADLTRLDTLVGFHTIYASDFNIYLILGQAYTALGDYNKALVYYDKDINNTIKESGESWVGIYDYLYRGILKYKMEDFPGALNDLDKEIRKYESLADSYYVKGLIYAKSGKPDESREQLQKALDLIKGKGYKHKDPYCEVQDEIYVSDVEDALRNL